MDITYHQKYIVGAHTSFSGKICDTLWTGINHGMMALQFFMGSPHQYNRSKISDKDLVECEKILARFPMHVFTHFPYTSNLAGTKDVLAWNGNDIQDRKTEMLLKGIEYELKIISNFKNSGVVIHPGYQEDRKSGLETIAKSINKINFPKNSKLILENSAGQGSSLATTLEELKTIIDFVDEDKRQYIGVCIDTCHTYAYGLYDLSICEQVDNLFSDFDRTIGLDKLTLIHLNDSETKMKSRVDRHSCLGTGYIWKEDMSSLKRLLEKSEEYNIPLILETHGVDMVALACLR